MLAKAVDAVPDQDSVAGGLSFEPKWDGFRAIVYFDGETVEIGSRGSKMLTRYFPELTDAFARLRPSPQASASASAAMSFSPRPSRDASSSAS